jgi:hypothetical protein
MMICKENKHMLAKGKKHAVQQGGEKKFIKILNNVVNYSNSLKHKLEQLQKKGSENA